MTSPNAITTTPNANAPVQEQIYTDAIPYFDAIISAIHAAQFQVDMEVYIFESNDIGAKVASALLNAAKRGVTVRLMVDGMGIDDQFPTLAQKLINDGVQLRIFRPLPWRVREWRFSRFGLPWLSKLWYLTSSVNRRNHRKMLLIDNHLIWLGSINISQNHFPQAFGGKGWRDTAIKITSTKLTLPREAFEVNWNALKLKHRKALNRRFIHSEYLFNFTRGLRAARSRKLIAQLDHAKQCIWLSNAYFFPDSRLLRRLESAGKRGVDVRLLLPEKSDVFFMPWVASLFYPRLLNAGVLIYAYRPTVLHAKTMIIDDWATIGSSNLNQRSFMQDLEVDYCIQCPENVQQLKSSFELDTQQAEVLNETALRKNKRWQRWLGALALLLFRPWL